MSEDPLKLLNTIKAATQQISQTSGALKRFRNWAERREALEQYIASLPADHEDLWTLESLLQHMKAQEVGTPEAFREWAIWNTKRSWARMNELTGDYLELTDDRLNHAADKVVTFHQSKESQPY